MHWVVCWRSEFMGYESFYCSQPKLIYGSLIWVSIVGDSLTILFWVTIRLSFRRIAHQPQRIYSISALLVKEALNLLLNPYGVG